MGFTQVFFIRDGFKFPDLVHALRPNPVNNIQEAWRFLDFLSYHPESAHVVRLSCRPLQRSSSTTLHAARASQTPSRVVLEGYMGCAQTGVRLWSLSSSKSTGPEHKGFML